MKARRIISVTLLLAIWSIVAPGQSIADSYIKVNVPDAEDFDRLLKRDLESYFKELTKRAVVVEHKLLRDGPTQSGTAFPKFYAWVLVKENGILLDEGAVRVGAMEKMRFAVYDYLARADIEKDIEKVYQVFPKPVGDKIKERVGK